MKKEIKYGSIVRVKKDLWEFYTNPKYTKETCPLWMRKHNGRAVVTHGPYIIFDKKNNKSWGIVWENTGQGITIDEIDLELLN